MRGLRESSFDGTEAADPPAVTAGITLTAEQKRSVKVLIVDDEETICDSCHAVLEQEGYSVRSCSRASEAEGILRQAQMDIVLLDLYMPGLSGRSLMRTALEARPDAVVIVITGKPSLASSVEVLRDGAWDYLPKPFSAAHIQLLVGRAAHLVMVARESGRAPATSGSADTSGVVVPLGESPAFVSVVQLARRVAATDASVFLVGESGTGKEMLAQLIHRSSRRRSRQLVALNCAAMPETLLESEMFGHVRGAFTGALRDKPGLMEVANGGTLFLDEITEMATQTQAKLLRAIQDGVVRRVGSTQTDAVVNVRFIAATNSDPHEAVAQKRLREDLYYRLRVVPIYLPPLRERLEDIPILARHFLSTFWHRHRDRSEPPPVLTEDFIRYLQRRPWPGNVRELQNVIEHAIVLAEGGGAIDVSNLPNGDGQLYDAPVLEGSTDFELFTSRRYHSARERAVAKFEKEYLTWALRQAEGNVSEAARVAGVHRATLYRLLEKHDLTKSAVLS
jgi:DNA-binding NtrC family response regulator